MPHTNQRHSVAYSLWAASIRHWLRPEYNSDELRAAKSSSGMRAPLDEAVAPYFMTFIST